MMRSCQDIGYTSTVCGYLICWNGGRHKCKSEKPVDRPTPINPLRIAEQLRTDYLQLLTTTLAPRQERLKRDFRAAVAVRISHAWSRIALASPAPFRECGHSLIGLRRRQAVPG